MILKTGLLVTALIIILLLIICFFIFKPGYKLEPISKFTIQGITTKSSHHVLDGYAVSFALSDSLIYVIDSNDSTNTKRFCYDYSGKPYTGFHFPTDKGYGEVFVDKNLFFLPQSNLLAYNHWQKQQIDYYTIDGDYTKSDFQFQGQNTHVQNIAEYNNSIYFTTYGSKDSVSGKTVNIMRLYKQQPGKAPIIIKHKDITKEILKKSVAFRALMLDDNGKDKMAMLERHATQQQVTLFEQGQELSFNISLPYGLSIIDFKKIPFQIAHGKKRPYQFVLGNKFVVLGYWTPNLLYPLEQRIYNMKGRYLGRLVFKDDSKNELVDIIGDRLVAFNPIKGVVSIYRISVK